MSDSKEILALIQNKLFTVGAILATEPNKENRLKIPRISEEDITFLEKEMDQMNEELPEMTHFILPGGHTTVSYCHIARTMLSQGRAHGFLSCTKMNPCPTILLSYINRLSDYLFVLARKLSKDLQAQEVKWIPEKLD